MEIYPTDTEILSVKIENASDSTIHYGEAFTLERRKGDGWIAVNDYIEGPGFDSPLHSVPPGEIGEHAYNLRTYAKTLRTGVYRITMAYTIDGGKETHWASVAFQVGA